MKAVVQRVHKAHVEIDGRTVGTIGRGLVVFAAVERGDGERERDWLARKLAGLRVFPGADGRLDRSARDLGAAVLLVSNFTVAGRLGKGTRPDFSAAADGESARGEFALLEQRLRGEGLHVAGGQFGADMRVVVDNDGPVTIVLERRAAETPS